MKKVLVFFVCFILIIVCLKAQEKALKDTFFADKEFNKNLSKWLHFHELSIDEFKLDQIDNLVLSEDSGSIYYRKFAEDQLSYDLFLEQSSPNKRRYVSLLSAKGVFFDKEKQQYCYGGGDDCEEVYYTDLDTKNNKIIQWNGVNQLTEDVVWLNDDAFALLSVDLFQEAIYRIDVYSILKDSNRAELKRYRVTTNRRESKDYFSDVVLTERNIKID